MLSERQQANKDLMEKVLGKKVSDEQFLLMMTMGGPKGPIKLM